MSDDPSPIANQDSNTSLVAHDLLPTATGYFRRKFLAAAGAILVGGSGLKLVRDRNEGSYRAEVVVAKVKAYEQDIVSVIRRGLIELGLQPSWARGKSVLLKPNLVEPIRDTPHINTHPAVVRAVVEVFRGWGASEVFVAEGQGHCRDSDLVLEQSGLLPVLEEDRIEFIDLNHDDVEFVPNRLRFTKLAELCLPTTLRRADLVVSLPKLKTHHWAGMTCAMKNLFGVMPGIYYGWPKNVLHREGISQSILDINGTVAPHLAIVDGIVGMEGDGPIMGSARTLGVLVMGTNLPAVDATSARLMQIDPRRIDYLAAASGRLGPIEERHIEQRGEVIASLSQRFALLDRPALSGLR
jgi:uncharacterized protein (DUF362 family)